LIESTFSAYFLTFIIISAGTATFRNGHISPWLPQNQTATKGGVEYMNLLLRQ